MKERKTYYSGKKKRHTLKLQVASTRKAKIVAVSKSIPGSQHDKRLYVESRTLAPPGVSKAGDLAYQGTDLKVPHKKPKGGTLTSEQKRYNKEFASRRTQAAEHAIGRMKRHQIMAQRFRNPRKSHTLIVKNIAGLTNLRFAA